jgi:hypothetical protein
MLSTGSVSIPHGSFVLPSDLATILGDGNARAGYAALDSVFHHALHTPNLRIVPEVIVKDIGHGDITAGRKVLRAFVTLAREKHKRIRNAAA